MDPELATATDTLRAGGIDVRLEYWKSHDGTQEIGRIKPDPPHWVVIDLMQPCLMETAAEWAKGKK